jgi:hypothetical protein
MSRTVCPSVLVLLALLVTPGARADSIEIPPIKDNTLYEDSAGALSNGLGSRIFTGYTLQPAFRRALVAFDVAGSLPAGSTIDGVTLTLEMVMSITGAQEVTLHRVEQDWGEGASVAPGAQGAGGPAAPGDATWIHTFFDTSFWNVPGGDFVSSPSASASVAGMGSYSWSSELMAADVQGWLDDPAGNFGWIIVGNEALPGSAKAFSSREAPVGGPVLSIEFTPPGGGDGGGSPVPALSSWGVVALTLLVLALASLALVRRSGTDEN